MDPQKIVLRSLDKIHTTSREIAKQWHSNKLSIVVFKEIIKKSKVGVDTTDKKVNDHNKKYNKLLDGIYDICNNAAKTTDGKSVDIKVIKRCIDTVKKGYQNK